MQGGHRRQLATEKADGLARQNGVSVDPCSAQRPGVRRLTSGWDARACKQPLAISIEVVGVAIAEVRHEGSCDSSESLAGSLRQRNGRVERGP